MASGSLRSGSTTSNSRKALRHSLGLEVSFHSQPSSDAESEGGVWEADRMRKRLLVQRGLSPPVAGLPQPSQHLPRSGTHDNIMTMSMSTTGSSGLSDVFFRYATSHLCVRALSKARLFH